MFLLILATHTAWWMTLIINELFVPGDETSNCLFLNSAIVLVKKSGKVNIWK